MLETLRQRLLETSDAYPTAADIPLVSLTLNENRITIDAEIHAAIRTAVPLPGRLPAWAPVSVSVDGKPAAALRRDDGYLWVVLPEGVHRARVEGLLADVGEWEWTFQLKPHRVTIDAPGWNFSGVRPDGVPEQQVFFARKQKSTAGEASYDRQDFQTVAAIDRNLELGLVWQVRSRVTRLSPAGQAIALRIPLLSGENVLSSNTVAKEGFIEVRLGANDSEFAWESELPVVDRIKLSTNVDDSWVERWHLIASPVWNLAISGLAPTFELGNPELVPVWHPWPGEEVQLAVSRPQAVAGATVTVLAGTHEIALGKASVFPNSNSPCGAALERIFSWSFQRTRTSTSFRTMAKRSPCEKMAVSSSFRCVRACSRFPSDGKSTRRLACVPLPRRFDCPSKAQTSTPSSACPITVGFFGRPGPSAARPCGSGAFLFARCSPRGCSAAFLSRRFTASSGCFSRSV